MTSEVAVLTKQAVALAADSALTSGGKIFDTANKVFALSKHQPVGIMAFSSGDVMGVPVETVIKEFRHLQGQDKHQHLEEYADHFEAFLATDGSLFTHEARRSRLSALVRTFAEELHSRAQYKLNERRRRGQKPNKTNVKGALADAITEFAGRVRSAKRIPVESPTAVRAAVTGEISEVLDTATGWFEQSWPTNSLMRQQIRRLALDQLFRDIGFGGETGFVIAGFGTNDVFPRLRAFDFYCSALGLHKVSRPDGPLDITEDCGCRILAFAQGDVVTTFMEGMDPVHKAFLEHFPETFFQQKTALLLGGKNPQSRKAAIVKSAGIEFTEALRKELEDLVNRQFVQPTMEVVAMMPKAELATSAEALVNLTGLKRRASGYAETVAGPTDVAVISKGDGFVWVKRKHYFDPKLNPGFMARYLEE